MVRYMLDTNMVSFIVKGRPSGARARFLAVAEDEAVCISVITEAEILYGLAKKPEATALKVLMDGFLAGIQVLPWGRAEAERYGPIRARLEADGISLGNLDMLIAAHAIVAGAELVTDDRAFAKIPELRGTVNWAADL